MRARNYCFTINFPAPLVPYELVPETWPSWISYACWQFEIGEEENTLHIQGYLECVGKRSVAQLLAVPGFDTQSEGYSIRFDIRRGSQEQAIVYCKKVFFLFFFFIFFSLKKVDDTTVHNTFVEFGERKAQGKRCDLDDIKVLLDGGAPLKRIADEHFGSFVRYHRSFKEYKRIVTPVRSQRTMVLVLWGASGVGKSVLARAMFPDAYWKTNSKWWDDYDGQEAVVWDEFKGQYPYRDLLRILDSTPLTCESKGSSVQFNSRIVVFTSNFHPKDWYDPEVTKMPWDRSPLMRRLAEYGQICCLDPPPVLGLVPGFGSPPSLILGNSINFIN